MPNKIEDPILRLIRQQQQLEYDVKAATKGKFAKQRDTNDPEFNYQGPMGYAGSGTKDRMPGTTPNNSFQKLLKLLRIPRRGGSQQLTIPTKDSGLI